MNHSATFSTTVSKEPAKLPPFEPQIDIVKWENSRNRQAPRIQSAEKQQEIIKQVNQMLEFNVIRPAPHATHYSQVLLTPKPNNKWRFCIDFRALNECMTSMGFPIPNIKSMFLRLGTKKAKYFAVCDLTSGYHQTSISASVRACFAFICCAGTFEWLRLPMGPKAAGSYFQNVMATIVLAGILYFICELYMDDIIIHGTTFEEFLTNLATVLERFKKYNITLNPTKSRLGYSEVQYVGHTINEHGLTMSREKREVVKIFPKPTTMKGLKSFLGLANYFRDHVRNHSIIVHSLHEMLRGYERHKKIIWTTQSESDFELSKKKLMNVLLCTL
jgi:hypothetical protein